MTCRTPYATPVDDLRPEERARYARHLRLPEVGKTGQARLKAARVLVVGLGGLGSPVATYLAAAGVGRLGLVDDDVVDASNLQRQTLYAASDVGRPKAKAAAERLQAQNPFVGLDLHDVRLTATNALDLVRGYDVVVDGSDNFATRYLVNDACVLAGIPDVYASVHRFEGQAAVFDARAGPCYRCLHPRPPPARLAPDCREAGVLGVLPGLLGLVQATEVLKILLGVGEPLVGKLLVVDALGAEWTTLRVPKDPGCAVCGPASTIRAPRAEGEACVVPEVSAAEATDLVARGGLLLDVRDDEEVADAPLALALHVPLAELASRLAEVPRDREVVVVCASGARSGEAVRRLREGGYTTVYSLRNGIARSP